MVVITAVLQVTSARGWRFNSGEKEQEDKNIRIETILHRRQRKASPQEILPIMWERQRHCFRKGNFLICRQERNVSVSGWKIMNLFLIIPDIAGRDRMFLMARTSGDGRRGSSGRSALFYGKGHRTRDLVWCRIRRHARICGLFCGCRSAVGNAQSAMPDGG